MKKIISISVFIILCFLLITCEGQGGGTPAISQKNELVIGGEEMPKSFNFLIDYGYLSVQIGGLIYQSLCERDLETYELKGLLAESWTISPDKLTFTFVLNKDAKWADGSPVTTDDVMFTYNTIMDAKNLTSIFRIDYENSFAKVYAPDKRTVVFKARSKRWVNFISACTFVVLPKHEYAGKDFNRDFNFKLPPGSGPYEMEKVEPDRFVVLKRRADYWADKLPGKEHTYNFERIWYKFIADDNIRMEALKKNDIDLMVPPGAKYWVEWTKLNPPFQIKQNWILARRIFNHKPDSYQAFHMNLRRKLFQDIRVRKALAYLINVALINEKIMYNQYVPLRSYFPGFFNTDPDLPQFDYDPEKARALLAEAGWDKVDSEGVLINDQGKRFEIEFLYPSQSLEKHLTIFKEDCAKVGVKINLSLISQAAFRKKVFEDHDFDITWVAWGAGGLFPSVDDVWKSDRAEAPNTNNIIGYKNPKLDRLIEIYQEEYDEKKRVTLLKDIDLVLTNDVATVLLWGAPYDRIFYWNKIQTPPKILEKYADAGLGETIYEFWKIEEQRVKALLEAVKNNGALPAELIDIFYDEGLKNQYAALLD
jgi:microcin C transport system substrate-binding protein